MKAVAEIAGSKRITISDTDRLADELKLQVANGYDQAAQEAREAYEVLGEPVAKATLNASCVLFAINALKACGYLNA
jgi:predicted deacetylase